MTPDMMTDAEWAAERADAARRFFGCSAGEFVRRFQNGDYEPDADHLERTLMLFPELIR